MVSLPRSRRDALQAEIAELRKARNTASLGSLDDANAARAVDKGNAMDDLYRIAEATSGPRVLALTLVVNPPYARQIESLRNNSARRRD